MNEEDKWNALIRSIKKAARILSEDLEEIDMPEYLNWRVGTDMNQHLWNQVYLKNLRRR